MSGTSDEHERTAGLAAKHVSDEPRLPWEVSSDVARRAAGLSEKPVVSHSAATFAEAGKIDVLTKIRALRQEMDRIYLARKMMRHRMDELEREVAEARAALADTHSQTGMFEQKKEEWRRERESLLSQILEQQEQIQEARLARDEAITQLEIARTTMSEITQALNWRDAHPGGEDEDPPIA